MTITLLTLAIAPFVLTSVLEALEWLVRLPVEIFQAYGSLLRWAVDSVQSLFEEYGYWVVFFGTLSENTLLVGLIVPGALVVILAGIAAHDGTISIPLALVLGVAGTVIGDTISYCMGRYGWSRFGKARFLVELSDKVREPLLRRGTAFILFYHFAGYTRVIGPASCGLLRMPFHKWAVADYAGAVLWILCYFAIGYVLGVFGLSLSDTDQWFRYLEWAIVAAMGIWVYFFLKSHTDLFDTTPRPDTLSADTRTDNETEAEAASTPDRH